MADTPKNEDKIVAGSGGATLYSYSNGEVWNWDRKPVVLPEGQYLASTGNVHNNPTLGYMYEVYGWRVEGKKDLYRTRDEARDSVKLVVNFTKIVPEYKWVRASQVRVEFNTSNAGNTPDPSSPTTQQQTEKDNIEEQLKAFVYDKNPNQAKHSSLVKGADDWVLTFPNGNSVPFKVFLAMTTTEQQNAAKVDLKTGLTGDPTTTTPKTDTASFPAWAYAVIGVVITAVLGLFMLSKPKSKK